MAVAVISPGRKQEFAPQREERVDPLDQILKGLQIASTVYGIKHNIDQNDLMKAKAASDQANYGTEQEFRKQQFETEKGFKEQQLQIERDKVEAARKAALAEAPGKALSEKTKQLDYETKLQNASMEKLAPEDKTMVSTLSTKNANKISISNQIDSVMKNWNSWDDNQKITQGRQLLKTLNSAEGADAIGVEEANRLGSLLEFKVFNVLNPGSVFGRDLEEFEKQALNTSKSLKSAAAENSKIIEQITGRKTKYSIAENLQSTQEKKPGFIESLISTPKANASSMDVGTQAEDILRQRSIKKQGITGVK